MQDPGSKIYICGLGDDLIVEYDLSTPWDISSAVYNGNFFDPTTQGQPIDITFNLNGTKIYILSYFDDTIYEYNLSTPWDITSATYSGNSKNISGQASTPYGLDSNANGTKFYVLQYDGYIYEYDLSTPWDISSAVYNGNFFDPSNENTTIQGFSITKDGTKLYTSDYDTKKIYEYNLSTPWDITSATYSGNSKDISGQATQPTAVILPRRDGTKMYIIGHINDDVYEYDLSTPWDISSAVYNNNELYISNEEYNPYGIRFLTGIPTKPRSHGYIF